MKVETVGLVKSAQSVCAVQTTSVSSSWSPPPSTTCRIQVLYRALPDHWNWIELA